MVGYSKPYIINDDRFVSMISQFNWNIGPSNKKAEFRGTLSNLLDQMTTFVVNHTANQLQIVFVSIGIPNKLVRVQLLL